MCNHKPQINRVNINKNICCDDYTCKRCSCQIRIKRPIKKKTAFIWAVIEIALILQICSTVKDTFFPSNGNIRSFLISVALIIVFSLVVYYIKQIVLLSLKKWVEADKECGK